MASTEKEIIGAPQDQHVLLTTDNLIFSMSRYLYLHIMYRLRRRERLLDVLRRMGQRREKRPVYQDVAPNHLRAPGAMVCLAVEARDESLRLPDTSHAQRIQAILEAAAYHLEMPAFSIYLAAICHQPLHRRGGHGARPRRASERRGREYFAVQLANQVGAPDQRGDAARGARGLSETDHIRAHAVPLARPAQGDTESEHHVVDDERHAEFVRRIPAGLQESGDGRLIVPGRALDHDTRRAPGSIAHGARVTEIKTMMKPDILVWIARPGRFVSEIRVHAVVALRGDGVAARRGPGDAHGGGAGRPAVLVESTCHIVARQQAVIDIAERCGQIVFGGVAVGAMRLAQMGYVEGQFRQVGGRPE